jgi:hypothetical protein
MATDSRPSAISSGISTTCDGDSGRFDITHQRGSLKSAMRQRFEYAFRCPELRSVCLTQQIGRLLLAVGRCNLSEIK